MTQTDQQLSQALAATIVSARRERNLSQQALARVAGITHQHLSRFERCQLQPTLISLNRIARALDTTGWKLLRHAHRIAQTPSPQETPCPTPQP